MFKNAEKQKLGVTASKTIYFFHYMFIKWKQMSTTIICCYLKLLSSFSPHFGGGGGSALPVATVSRRPRWLPGSIGWHQRKVTPIHYWVTPGYKRPVRHKRQRITIKYNKKKLPFEQNPRRIETSPIYTKNICSVFDCSL